MPIRGKNKREALTEFLMARLTAAARTVFSEQGFYGATIEEIARSAGVAKGTVYLYYPSKQAAYWAAMREDTLRMIKVTRLRMESAGTVETKIRTFIDCKIGYFEENREFSRIYFSEFGQSLTRPARLRKQFKTLYTRQARMLRGVLKEGIRKREIRPVPAGAAAFAICDLTRSLAAQRMFEWNQGKLREATNFVFELVWKGLGSR